MDYLVLFQEAMGVGWITLNRPKALNALNAPMVEAIERQLKIWEDSPSITLVCIEGAGEKGLCAGGDMRSFYDEREGDIESHALDFFATEYRMNHVLASFPKPILVYMNGIVMGGGIGISVYAGIRIVTDRTRMAMPEMNIGYFPDVGASYFLNKTPGAMGKYMALTAQTFNGADAIYLGLADMYLQAEKWSELKEGIQMRRWESLSTGEVGACLTTLLLTFVEKEPPSSKLIDIQKKVDAHFSLSSVPEILQSLEKAEITGDEWAGKTRTILLGKSPTSLVLALNQLVRGKDKSLGECLRMELNMDMHIIHSHDFYEGIRSVLVDKDRNPKWAPDSLADITEEQNCLVFHQSLASGSTPFKALILIQITRR